MSDYESIKSYLEQKGYEGIEAEILAEKTVKEIERVRSRTQPVDSLPALHADHSRTLAASKIKSESGVA